MCLLRSKLHLQPVSGRAATACAHVHQQGASLSHTLRNTLSSCQFCWSSLHKVLLRTLHHGRSPSLAIHNSATGPSNHSNAVSKKPGKRGSQQANNLQICSMLQNCGPEHASHQTSLYSDDNQQKQRRPYIVLLDTPEDTAVLATTQRRDTNLHLLGLATNVPGRDTELTHSPINAVQTRGHPLQTNPRSQSRHKPAAR